MSRSRSARIEEVKQILLERLREGYQFVGDRFPSARELAARYQISYQTADRLLKELVAEGQLVRRHGSGTFVASKFGHPPERALLIFNRRAARAGSFGAGLLERLERHLKLLGVPFEATMQSSPGITERDLPVFWEAAPRLLEQTARSSRFSVLLNARPLPGLRATWVDAVAVDDFSGGVCAAEMLHPRSGHTLVFGGPAEDPRSAGRIAGFLSVLPKATVIHAGTWFAERAGKSADEVAAQNPRAVFCCNDRLAQAVLAAFARAGKSEPKVVGFDDAPIARDLGLSTVALPWEGLVQAAGERILKRLSGDAGHAAQIILAPRPVRRGSA